MRFSEKFTDKGLIKQCSVAFFMFCILEHSIMSEKQKAAVDVEFLRKQPVYVTTVGPAGSEMNIEIWVNMNSTSNTVEHQVKPFYNFMQGSGAIESA